MRAKFFHVGHVQRRPGGETRWPRPHGDFTWAAQLLLIVAMLALLAVAYGVWHIMHTEAPYREVPLDTLMSVPGPVP
jgi:hypothetical protein